MKYFYILIFYSQSLKSSLFFILPAHFNSGQPIQVLSSPFWIAQIYTLAWRRDRLPTPVFLGCPRGSAGKESTCNAGDLGSIPGLGRSPGGGKGYPLQYSGLEKSMESQRVSTTERFSLSLSNFGRKGLWVFIFGQWKAIEGVLIREKNDLRCTYKNVSSLNTRTLFLAPRSVPDKSLGLINHVLNEKFYSIYKWK